MSKARATTRVAIARVLTGVMRAGRSLGTLTESDGPLAGLAPSERAYALACIYGSLRHWSRLEHAVRAHLKRPIRNKDTDVLACLVAGAYELETMHAPVHAVVNEQVDAVAALGKVWARGLVNAVLRKLSKADPHAGENSLEAAERQAGKDAPPNGPGTADSSHEPPPPLALATSHPQWLVDALSEAWPGHVAAILDANNRPGPMTLRVNLAVTTRAEMQARLEATGFVSTPGRFAASALVLAAPTQVTALPGFAEGHLSVQDEAAQLVADIAVSTLAGISAPRILDACAAPGGKTLALAERFPNAKIDAVEIDPVRIVRLEQNLARATADIRDRVRVVAADLSGPVDLPHDHYDYILCDAPCSATGVIRRHPDIKWLRRESDIPTLVALQRQILRTLWPLLKRNGILHYATCSVLPEENSAQARWFSQQPAGCRPLPIPTLPAGNQDTFGHVAANGRQILPGEDDMDGFFHALFKHTDASLSAPSA